MVESTKLSIYPSIHLKLKEIFKIISQSEEIERKYPIFSLLLPDDTLKEHNKEYGLQSPYIQPT